MSHNVEKMAYVGTAPWWMCSKQVQGDAIGIQLGDEAVTSAKVMEAAGLDWQVSKRRSAFLDDTPCTYPLWKEAEGERFLVRSSDGSVLGRCTESYVEYQNAEAFKFLDGLVDDGQLVYHTAGSLEGGQRVWILAQTPDSWTIQRRSGAQNKHHAFLMAMLGHRGNIGISLMPTDVRAVCANTVGWADSKAEGENLVFRIQHRGDIDSKLQLAAQALKVMRDQTDDRRQVLQAMAQDAMNTDEFVDFATSIFLGLDGDADTVEEETAKFYEESTARSKTIMENKVAKVADLFLHGKGNEGDTGYDAVQAFTEYFDHFDLSGIQDKIAQGKRAAKVIHSSWLGADADRKALVYKRLAERAKA